jgi:hypothetical protein
VVAASPDAAKKGNQMVLLGIAGNGVFQITGNSIE